MKTAIRIFALALGMSAVSLGLRAEATPAAGNDTTIQLKATKQFAKGKEFRNVQPSVTAGVITLTGRVELYQQKLDAAKKAGKIAKVQGVRNLIEVDGKDVPDAQLAAELDRKLYYDRMGYDIAFNYLTVSVEHGVATMDGEVRTDYDLDSALGLVSTTPGVKDAVNRVKVAPTSIFDDQLRIRAMRAIYRDPVLRRYAIDPAYPIRIVVDNGHLSLYGTVDSQMDKTVAGMRANQVFGAFTVQNNLEVAKTS
jgi:hyperosmotically inducible periplasmic protein